jgi:membrane-bound serine protease (ClpP class)
MVAVSALGLVLLAAGGGLLVAEAHVPSNGVLGFGGVAGLIAGSALFLSGVGAGPVVASVVAAIAGGAALGLLLVALPRAAATRRRRVRAGAEAMIGHVGVVRPASHGGDHVFVDGALWSARPADPADAHEALHEGDRVVVEELSGLTLSVRKAEDWEVPR